MKCEVEFLPVGEATKAGDAIVIRYGTEYDYKIMVIDGGTQASGEELVAHIKKQYGEEAVVEHCLLTHSDADHASGLREVLRELPVNNLWLHVPWLSASISRPYYKNKNWTDQGLSDEIRKNYDIISELIDLANAQKTPIYQPFTGLNVGPFKVLSPYKDVYPLLVPQFDRTPEPDQAKIEATGYWIGKQSLLAKAYAALKESVTWTKETMAHERLKDGGITGASNESSVVLFGVFDEGKVLLTGDAGVFGLTTALDYAASMGLDATGCKLVQIPHHGSRSNVGPTILNRLIGPIKPPNAAQHFSAYVSAPADDEKHPRKMVTNAFRRRGARISATQGVGKVYRGGFPLRPGYGPSEEYPFHTDVEDYT